MLSNWNCHCVDLQSLWLLYSFDNSVSAVFIDTSQQISQRTILAATGWKGFKIKTHCIVLNLLFEYVIMTERVVIYTWIFVFSSLLFWSVFIHYRWGITMDFYYRNGCVAMTDWKWKVYDYVKLVLVIIHVHYKYECVISIVSICLQKNAFPFCLSRW